MSNLFYFIKSLLVNLPTSKSLSLNWNFGSQLGFILGFQLFTGVFLVFYFTAESSMAFSSVVYIMSDVNYGWLFRVLHFNGASLFFFFLYLHIFKGLFFSSYRLWKVWSSGIILFLCIMMEAFMGYVLVWAQMSFWASVVITSLLSVIPIWGNLIVTFIWSGFSVGSATLKFFFVLHFFLPWLFILLVLVHLIFLHDYGSTSKILCHGDYDKIYFFSYYWWKDGYNILLWGMFFIFSFLFPFILGDPEMFIEADPLLSPVHIIPEWYFLFAYAILRAIPNKVLGVIFLLFSILIFFFFIVKINFYSLFSYTNKFLVFILLVIGVFLSWLGQCLVEPPFLILSSSISFFYFFFIFFILVNYYISSFLFKFVFIMN